MILDPATKYARAAIHGKIKVSRLARLACQRHLRDLKTQKRLKLFFDAAAAHHAIDFIETFLVLAEGDHANRPFLLRPWQKFIIGNIFGWKLLDGSRRFRRAYIEIAKGNGKTPLGAAMALYCLVADGEESAEIYSAAAAKSQAEICFRDAKIMAEKAPELAEMLDISEHNIAHHDSYSFFRPVSAETRTLDGKRVHFALVDEVHVHRSPVVVQKMVAGLKGRRQPMICEMTNSGWDKSTVCGEHHDYGVEILEQVRRDESWFVFICGLDPCKLHLAEGDREPHEGCKRCDHWTDERVWIKANPNLNYSVPRRYLRERVKTALGIPSEQNEVKRYNFCIWTQLAKRWLSMTAWQKCRRQIDMQSLIGRPCYVGLDFATKIDFAAMVLLFAPTDVPTFQEQRPDDPVFDAQGNRVPRVVTRIDLNKMVGEYLVVPYFWMPKDAVPNLAKDDGLPYDLWVRNGFIETSDGDVIDYGNISNKLLALNDIYQFKAIGFDPANARQFAISMINDHQLPMIEIGQGNTIMSEPTKEVERLIIANRLSHDGNPLMTAMANHAQVREDSKRRIHIEKPAKNKKIDGVVATIIAMCASINTPDLRSIYETRGLLSI